ncbi:sensor histidine kinase [Paenibacillus chartarius]|uniref:histidine kinase n=1 Tax=Paenibacillus chartarius TaxID=747481 RepID=A0ABV6DPK4_9BACL
MMFRVLPRYVLKLLYHTKLRNKILFTYIAFILLPLGLFQIIASERISGILLEQSTYSARQGFELTYSFLRYRLQRVEETSDTIAVTPSLSAALREVEGKDTSRQMEMYQELKQTLRSFEDDIDVAKVMLYMQDDIIFANERENFLPMEQAEKAPCFQRLRDERAKLLWCTTSDIQQQGSDSPYLHVVRNLLNTANYAEILGRIQIDVKKSVLQSILAKADVVKNSVTYLRDAEGRMILSSQPGAAPQLDDELPGNDDQTYVFDNGTTYYLYHPIPSSQWSMVTEIPLIEIVEESRKLRNFLLILLLIIATVAYFIAYVLAHSITRRISQLITHLKDVQSGALVALPRKQGRDEVGELIHTYNFMVNKIEDMNKEQYRLGQEMKNAELKALQSQINPHFLYNTLDMINWMANRGMNQDIKGVVKALSRFYKLSLSNGRDIISLREEIDHVSFYVQIQNIRFDHKIDYAVEVPEELLETPIPKITLQPIVENAIMHGILGRVSREGSIRIRAYADGSDLVVAVEDNGIGMDPDKLAKLQSGTLDASETGSGYGAMNVKLRLQSYFGEEYGLTYASEAGKGTLVTVRIPRNEV